jgi:hypothetical protein
MTKLYDHKEFQGFRDPFFRRLYTDIIFKSCSFVGCTTSNTKDIKRRSIVRNIQLIHCEVRGVMIGTPIVEEVLVSGLRTHNMFSAYGAIFKHVKLEGNIGQIMLHPYTIPTITMPKAEAAFESANAEYYKTVDWALDISEGRFNDCDIRGIPAKLIKRDPASQAVVTREKALAGDWKKLDLSKTYLSGLIQLLLESGENDIVIIAGKRSRGYEDMITGIKMLRDAGIAEPD